MPIDVLHILGSAQTDGTSITRMVGELAQRLNQQQYRVHIWFLGDDGPLTSQLERFCASVRVVKWNGGRFDPIGAWRFWRALRHNDFKIIHQHFGGRSVRWLTRRAGLARVIVHIHGRVAELDSSKVSAIRIQDADAVIAISQAVAHQVDGFRPYVVYPGVHIKTNGHRMSAGSSQETGKIVGTACRLVPIKGVGCLIRALALLRVDIPDICLEIAGSGDERSALEREVNFLGMDRHVKFLGWQTDLASLLSRWDVFALPSLEEGFGMAALEAMAAGLPVVATAVGGIPELVEDGKTGWLVPSGDPVAFADRLREVLLSPQQRLAMGSAGRVRASQTFSSDGMVESISKIYDRLLFPNSHPTGNGC